MGLKTEKERPLLAQEIRECSEGVCTILCADCGGSAGGKLFSARLATPADEALRKRRVPSSAFRNSREELVDELSVLTLGARRL